MKAKNRWLSQHRLAIAILLLLCGTFTAFAQTAEQIVEKALAATVYLEMKDITGETSGVGSGFFVKSDLIVTNYYIIAGAVSGIAKLVGKETHYTIEGFTGIDEINGLVLLKVNVPGVEPLSLGSSGLMKIGDTVYVVGSRKGVEGLFSEGILKATSGTYRNARFKMTALVSPEGSGGPVLNRKAQVIGVAYTAGAARVPLNFVIPSHHVKDLRAMSRGVKPLSANKRPENIYLRQGNDLLHHERYKEAVEDYTKALRLKPDYSEAYNNRGFAKAALAQYFEAITDYDIAIEFKPDYALAYFNRGFAKAALGQHFSAIADYDTALQFKPDYALTYFNRGEAKAALGQHFSAIADYDTVIQRIPDAVKAYNGRGLAKAALGQPVSAIADYDTAIQLRSDYPEAYLNRGKAKVALGKHTEAITDYNIAIRLKSDYPEAYLHRGRVRLFMNRTSEGRQDLRTALKFAKNAGDVDLMDRIQEMLCNLKK